MLRRRTLLRVASVAVLLVGMTAWASLGIRGTTQWVFSATRGLWFDDVNDFPHHEVGIIPGSAFRNGRPNPQLAERLQLALDLYFSRRIESLLVSGDEERQGHEVSGMRRWLIDRGVPESRIMADPLGVRTMATMTRAAHFFGVRSAVICTQSWAAPRAVFLARAVGMEAIALVPKASPVARKGGREDLKIVLAFVEHYLLGRTRLAAPSATTVALREQVR